MERVTKARPCVICERQKFCLRTPNNERVICTKVKEGSKKWCENASGWLHILVDDPNFRRRKKMTGWQTCGKATKQPKNYGDDHYERFTTLAQQYTDRMTPTLLDQAAKLLSVSAESLTRLRIGVDHRGQLTFPMSDGHGRVIGIRTRNLATGKKLAERNSHNGLFVPEGLTNEGPLLLCEGPSDTAAALDLGFAAIGRPFCRGGAELLPPLVRGRNVVVVCDNDEDGREGGRRLARTLVLQCKSVKLFTPGKPRDDLRDAVRDGLTAEKLNVLLME